MERGRICQFILSKEEDTIDKIAGLYDVSVEEIAYINQIPYPYRLAVGEALLIPDGVSPGVKMTALANGYAYPYISPWVLRQTLPLYERTARIFLWFYGGGRIDSTGAIR